MPNLYINKPIKGRISDVGGMLSVTNIKKTVIDNRVVIPIVTYR